MEILLAIVVASAVIFFGALISVGNERQRKAIDGLREQVVLWAVQDLKIKRQHLSQTVQVPDPVGWLNKTASRVCGYDLKLQVLEVFEEPQTLICMSGDDNEKIVFSPLSPADLRQFKRGKNNRLLRLMSHNPILFLPRRVNVYEISALRTSYIFDLELTLAWQSLTGKTIDSNQLWVYKY